MLAGRYVDTSSKYRNFVTASRLCYDQYQRALSSDVSFGPVYRFTNLSPRLALVLLDTRFEHSFGANHSGLLGSNQWDALRAFSMLPSTEHVILASSVPLVTLNTLLSLVIQVTDGDSYPLLHHADEVVQLLEFLRAHNAKRPRNFVAVAGDLHHFAYSTLRSDDGFEIPHFITSGLTSGSTAARSNHIAAMVAVSQLAPPRLPGWQQLNNDVFLGKNFLRLDFGGSSLEWEVFKERLPYQTHAWWRNEVVSHWSLAVALAIATAFVTFVVILVSMAVGFFRALAETNPGRVGRRKLKRS